MDVLSWSPPPYVFHALSHVGICELTEAISRKRLDGNLCDPRTTPLQSPPRNPCLLRRDRLFSSQQRRPKNNITTSAVSAFKSVPEIFGRNRFFITPITPRTAATRRRRWLNGGPYHDLYYGCVVHKIYSPVYLTPTYTWVSYKIVFRSKYVSSRVNMIILLQVQTKTLQFGPSIFVYL